MSRTGKSNTVKKLIQATVALSQSGDETAIGQIIFDVNGEYANANQQDEGTAIFEQYPDDVTRYSVINKPGFKVLKLNFYREIAEGFGMLVPLLAGETGDYVKAFTSIDWEEPDQSDVAAKTRYDRKVAAYKACLHKASFPDNNERVRFSSCKELMQSNIPGLHGVDPKKGLSLSDAAAWYTAVWENYTSLQYFIDYKRAHGGRDWADEDLQSIMRVLTRKREPGGGVNITGYRKLMPARDRHTSSIDKAYADEIIELLRDGKIVIIDLSQGNPEIQRIFSDRVCQRIFDDAMQRFIGNEVMNYIQLYFEEAHNLFPRKDDKDLTVIYNRLAKEGQKLRLGLNYATQEVSSISSSILKNTQNWFISHLNNEDELREIKKYYDFEDFTESLKRTTDKGFIRMKTDSNTFIVPVQIDRFSVSGTA
jgi:hypothetical protein